ncbi:MAG: hypothetical protein JWP75_674, partial [Frondihabitans sp.]|nr:hypothetical protein [Frondihabitans sp.]
MIDPSPAAVLTARVPSPSSPLPSRHRSLGVLAELAGFLGATVVALLAMAHLVLSGRSTVFFYSGDSVLMPLVERSLREGQPFEWAMSSVLFFVPEIPVYTTIAAIVPGVHADLVVNAIVILVALYAILRGLIGVVLPQARRRLKIAVALAPIAVLLVCSLMEHTDHRGTLELVSLFLTTTYYYGTTLALVGTIALMIGAVAGSSVRRRRAALAGIVLTATLATFSNPLFALWATVPGALALALLFRRGLVARRPLVVTAATLVGGSVLGYLARTPLQKYVSIELGHYFRFDRMMHSISFYVDDYFSTASSWQGAVEMTLLTVAVTGVLAIALVALIRRWPTRITLGLTTSATSILVTVAVAIVLGTTATRYLMPLFFAPTAASVVLAAYAVERIPQLTGLRLRRPGRRIPGALVAVSVALASVVGVAATRVIESAPSTQTYAAATCLAHWVGNRDLTGVGRFWTMRALKTYGSPAVKILQISADYNASLWLDNAADYTGQDISYLVVDHLSSFSESPVAELGPPVTTITCGEYSILDYLGTKGETILTQRVGDS